ncbi:alpha/beta hydrolase-fold protein [Ktedonosporobacter rubrisoli]|nr:alpha/beta hydrolase-fold protein [Ktedonosporobacter rubrisoli]
MKKAKIFLLALMAIIVIIACGIGLKKYRATMASVTSTHSLAENTTLVDTYGYLTRKFIDARGTSLTYYFYIPAHYNPKQKYPLVLLLHGGGERSKPTNTISQNQQVLFRQAYIQVWSAEYKGPANPDIQQRWPCFVVVPQIAASQQWVNVPIHQGSYTQPSQPSDPLRLSRELLDSLQQQYKGIDANRLYITGISQGGHGVWDAIERWPDYFAAAAPIAGAGDPSKASALTHLPIWAFHGSKDESVPVTGSRDMITAIEAAGGHPRYTEFEGQPHGVWDYAYSLANSPLRVTNFFSWLFAQQKAGRSG